MYIHQQQDNNCKIREFIVRCQTEIVIRFKKNNTEAPVGSTVGI
jgi:hypothetical protein